MVRFSFDLANNNNKQIDHLIYFSQSPLLFARTNENRTISGKPLFIYYFTGKILRQCMENQATICRIAIQEASVSWHQGAQL